MIFHIFFIDFSILSVFFVFVRVPFLIDYEASILNNSAGHRLALQIQKGKQTAVPGRVSNVILGAGPSQPRTDQLHEKATREAYSKIIQTAYELALNPQYPLSSFKLLIKCQSVYWR